MRIVKRLEDVYVIEDFLPDPDAVRQAGLHMEYEDWEGPDGAVYKRICRVEIQQVKEMLEAIFGKIDLMGMAYRLNYKGEPPNQSIHSDMGWGTHALVLYLTDGPSGTAFWQHTKTGANRILPGDMELFEQVKDDFENEDAWDQRAFVKMDYNRALIYSGELFHSRYPFKAFGSTPEDGRLIVVAFFTPLGDAQDEDSTGE
jgi:hypothetical protein